MCLDKFTIKQLRKIADDKNINLQGRDKKQDIIDTILDAGFKPKDHNSECGYEHEKAIALDRAATLKAMK